jgi:hypothetical protein
VQPGGGDRLAERLPAVDVRREHLQQGRRDAVGAGGADGEHRAVVGPTHRWRHVRREPLTGVRECGPERFSSGSPRQLFSHSPVPGVMTPEP